MSITGPIRVDPENPHYLLYDGTPAILITSAEHYGAVVNQAFDYIAYFDMLARYGMNYTRIYPGAYFEIEGMFIQENTLAPSAGELLLPWARSGEPGYALGGNKFDLMHWDEAYFHRLRDFLSEAEKRDIIVEICLFNAQYPQCWHVMAINANNNIQGVGRCHYNDVQTLKDPGLVNVLEKYVAKITLEANPFDNVILEICDEPSNWSGWSAAATKWISRLIDVIVKTETSLPKKHLIAQQLELGVDFTEDDRVPLITTQYIYHNEHRQIGGPEALDCLYLRNKPMELNESAYFPIWYTGDMIAASRVEAWEFMVGGGTAFNQLNGIFTVKNPNGNTPENHIILSQLKTLKEFLISLDILAMKQDVEVVKGGVPRDAVCRCISNPGIQYALYLHHSELKKPHGTSYVVKPAQYVETLELNLPAGAYEARWVEPAAGATIRTERVLSDGGSIKLTTPEHRVDIALKIDAVK